MSYEALRVERHGPVGWIVFDRPEAGNAMDARMMAELETAGRELDADPEELSDHAARKDVAYEHKASMLQDVEARRQTEIDFLNGGIVRFGGQNGVPTPLNAAVAALVIVGEIGIVVKLADLVAEIDQRHAGGGQGDGIKQEHAVHPAGLNGPEPGPRGCRTRE